MLPTLPNNHDGLVASLIADIRAGILRQTRKLKTVAGYVADGGEPVTEDWLLSRAADLEQQAKNLAGIIHRLADRNGAPDEPIDADDDHSPRPEPAATGHAGESLWEF